MTDIKQILLQFQQHTKILEKVVRTYSQSYFQGTWIDSQNKYIRNNHIQFNSQSLLLKESSLKIIKINFYVINTTFNQLYHLKIINISMKILETPMERFSAFQQNQSITEIYANLTMILNNINLDSKKLDIIESSQQIIIKNIFFQFQFQLY
ncbi:unnamed protein product [Paramecium sonneborni]|uniref:Uncharacterized protein n=1 Tax=Paramecium sonneborni TaxID=65129 RepID=A0A8S1R009_9CILI|nr:unnamed protein product [Paramecium sonneborni]